MPTRCFFLCALFAVFGYGPSADAALVYAIDLNGAADGTPTQAGFAALNPTADQGFSGNVIVGDGADAINFRVAEASGSRLRTGPNGLPESALLTDFFFSSDAVGVTPDRNLPAGLWRVEIWGWDNAPGELMDAELWVNGGADEGGQTLTMVDDFAPTTGGPAATYTFTATGTDGYDFYVREANAQNRARFNAIRLTAVPEPGSLAVLSLVGTVAMIRRRQATRGQA